MSRAPGGGRIASNMISGWSALGISVATSLFLTPFVIQRTGVAVYGVFLLVESLLGYTDFLYLGLGAAISRYAATFRARDDMEGLRRLGGTVLVFYLGAGAVVAAGSWVLAPLIPRWFSISAGHADDAVWVVRCLGLAIAVTFPSSAFSGLLRGYEYLAALNGIKIGETILRAALLLAFLEPEGALRVLAATGLASATLAALARVALCVRYLTVFPDPRRFDRRTLRGISGFAGFSLLGTLAERLLFRTDAIVIGAHLPSAAITAYGVPARLVDYLRQILMKVREVLQPRFALLSASETPDGGRSMLLRGGRWAALLALPLSAGMAALGGRFIEIWIGEPFPEAPLVLGCLALAQLARSPSFVCESALWGQGRVGLISALTVTEACCNLGLSIWWVREWGIPGVAAGTLAPSLLFSVIWMPRFACRVAGVPLGSFLVASWARPLAAALPMGAALWAYPPSPSTGLGGLAGRMALALLLYVPLAWAVGLGREERRRLGPALRASLRRRPTQGGR